MNPAKIKHIVTDKAKDVVVFAQKAGVDFDAQMIHDFRVSVKDLRSFLRLLRHTHDDKKLKITKKIKRLYHICGSIRDAQLELKRIAEHDLPFSAYADRLRRLIQNLQKEWEKRYSKKTATRFLHKLSACEYESLHAPSFIAFVHLKSGNVSELSKIKFPTDNELHTIRKLVKDVLYNLKTAHKKWKPAALQITYLQVGELSHLADLIGDYNNERVMLEHLLSFSSKTMTSEEESATKTFCAAETQRLRTRKKKIMAEIRKWITLHKES